MTDLIIHGARIDGRPGASALAVSRGRIEAIGSDSELLRLVGRGTRLLDAAGGTLTAGLIDSHAHPFNATTIARGADAGEATRWEELAPLVAREAERLAGPHGRGGEWIRLWNVDYAAFDGPGMTAEALDRLTGDVPCFALLFDGHTAVVNTAALRLAGLTGRESFSDGAVVVTDEHGAPTGELREYTAYSLVLQHAPALTRDEEQDVVRDVLSRFNAAGVTGVTALDGSRRSHETFAELDASATGLTARMIVALQHAQSMDDAAIEDFISMRGNGGRRWRGGVVKLFHDDVIDTGTAWLYEADTMGDGTEPFWPRPARFGELVERFARAGFQIATHAIGDRAVGETITAYERVGVRSAVGAPHRIEHLETLTDADLGRIADLGITASMQPLHMQWRAPDLSDAWASRLGPERSALGWRAADVLRAGAPLVLGSDWPVADFDPRVGMAWARLRRPPGQPDAPVWEPDQRLSGRQALTAMTEAGAVAAGDRDRGRIGEGLAADLTLWAEDPVATPADELVALPVTATVVDGAVVWEADGTGR